MPKKEGMDIKLKIAAVLVTIIVAIFGGAFFAEDRWNQTTAVALAKDEVKDEVKDGLSSIGGSIYGLNDSESISTEDMTKMLNDIESYNN